MHAAALILAVLFVSGTGALYENHRDVVELTESNFKTRVLESNEIWIVEFFAPWCGHCKQLAPEYTKLAGAMRGFFKVGAVDMTVHQSVGQPYNVRGFPTIKIFGANKNSPTEYQGARTAQAIADAAMSEMRKAINANLGGGRDSGSGGGGGGSRSGGSGGGGSVIELTESNFDRLVLNSDDVWLVEFFAPWCGHCKNLKPHWDRAASELAGKVKLGALDATVHSSVASRFGIQGYPTIKYFAPGSSESDAVDYTGGRVSSDIVQWAMEKVVQNVPAPEVVEAVSQAVIDEACVGKQLCVLSVLPDILDCQSGCRNDYLKILNELSEKFKKNMWGWVWTEAGKQRTVEDAFGIGGFGYPAMAAVNFRKMKFSMLKGPFSLDGISEFLRDLSYGKGETAPVKGGELPKVVKVDPWDGKDGVMPEEEELDLSDVEFDDEKQSGKARSEL